MLAFRAVLSVAMIVLGGIIILRMMPYPIGASFTGIVLGVAMIALGIVRLRAILRMRRT